MALGHFMGNKAWQDLACLLKKKCVCVCVWNDTIFLVFSFFF